MDLSKVLKIKNINEKKAELYFHGLIVSDWWGAWDGTEQYPQSIKTFLDGVKGKSLDIYINSDGGAVFAGMAIYNMLKRHEGEKTVYIDGIAASVASVIAFAGDKVIMPANTFMMIHRASINVYGNTELLQKYADILGRIDEGIMTVYTDNMKNGVTEEEIRNIMNGETYMTAQETARFFNVQIAPALQAVAYAGDFTSRTMPQGIVDHNLNLSIEAERINLLKIGGINQ